VKLQTTRHRLQLAHPWEIARTSRTKTLEVVTAELICADEIVGLGEAAPVSRYKESADSVEAFLAKVDPKRLLVDDLVACKTYLDSIAPGNMAAKCAVDLALVDVAAQRASLPVYDLLKLGFQEHKHATSFTIGIDSPEYIKSKAIEAESFPIIKMKVGVLHDEANLRALREVAPHKTIRVDANEGWTSKEEALRMIERLAADSNIEFVEQPMSASMPVKDWAWLKERSPLPIFGDESYHAASDAERASECFHGINVKLSKSGGISGAFEALMAAKRVGLKTMLGCMIESSVLISAAAHLAELCDYLDLDGNLLITNDPYAGVTAPAGILSFAGCSKKSGLRVTRKK
jgi:L-Ala-D/L-Glu epimerase